MSDSIFKCILSVSSFSSLPFRCIEYTLIGLSLEISTCFNSHNIYKNPKAYLNLLVWVVYSVEVMNLSLILMWLVVIIRECICLHSDVNDYEGYMILNRLIIFDFISSPII